MIQKFGNPGGGELSRRDLEILKAVVLAHVLSAEPVSSRTIAKSGRLRLSAASIRNVMADLEEWGFLSQPHTSAGRVPTPAGYHLFIDSVMKNRRVPKKERLYIEQTLDGGNDADELMSGASHLLSELSQQVGIVVTPALGKTVLRTVDFVPLSGCKVLCVVVSESGFIDNKVITTDEPVSRETLVRISNYLTENFAGSTLEEVRERLLRRMTEERAEMNQLLGVAIELAQRGLSPVAAQNVVLDGTSSILTQPEMADVQRVRRLFDTFEDRAQLVTMLNQCIKGEGVRVVIGEDSDLTSKLDFSLVATSYAVDESARGAVGIFGPSRMPYDKVIPLVHFLGEALSRRLAGGQAGEGESP